MKKEIAARTFLLLCTIMATIASISGVLNIKTTQDLIFQVLFLPVSLFFIFETIQVFFLNKKPLAESLFSGRKPILIFSLSLLIIVVAIKSLNLTRPKETKLETTPIPVLSSTPTPQPTKDNLPKITIKTKNPQTIVNLREAPSTNSEIIGGLKSGQVYSLIEEKGDWYNIKIDENTKGWVYKDYIQK